jgi:hypothetical protein
MDKPSYGGITQGNETLIFHPGPYFARVGDG